MNRILIAEDEAVLRRNLVELLRGEGYEVAGAADGEAALDLIRGSDFDLLISDIRMPRMDGITLLRRVVDEAPRTRVLLCTAYGSVDTAVDALRHGAYDYLLKPVVFEDLLQKVRNLMSVRRLEQEVRQLRRVVAMRVDPGGMVAESEASRAVLELVHKVAPTRSTVLITGESGTGKELVARAIHQHSPLADRPFVAANVAALPADTLESQLFGHERGAFTGAVQRSEGLIRSARGGTLFLDEVGELGLSAQVKLLRAIENREVLPVGASRPVKVDFRLLAATNRDLTVAVARGELREDLYYRLNVFRIEVPPLRERRDDIGPLVRHFIRIHGERLGQPPCEVSNEAMRLLLAYPWPGNVRELSNIVERAMILAAGDTLTPGHLPAEIQAAEPQPVTLREAVAAAERRHIAWVLRSAGGNRDEAARLLGIDRATLYRRLRKYALDP